MPEILYSTTGIIKEFPKSRFKLETPKIDLAIGSITGVVGENGNGKTTLLNIIAGNLAPTKAKVSYFGATPETASDWMTIKDKIAFIPQRIPKWYGTLLQNLQLKAAIEKIPSALIDAKLDEILAFLDLEQYKHLKWSEISTGYRLRFELARVLIGSPKLLVLDEPIANLDINAQQKFLSDLKTLSENTANPIAVILSSQQLHEIETVASQMIFIKKGKVLFSGNVDTLETNSSVVELLVEQEDKLEELLTQKAFSHNKRGVYHQIDIKDSLSNEFLYDLIQAGITINYYRDISKSTKKLF